MEIMRENIKLIKQIGQLRKEVKSLTSKVKKHDRNFLYLSFSKNK